MNKMVSTVEKEISEKLSQFFGLMIDGWTEMGSSTHYLGVFGLFSDKSTGQSVCPLLAFSLLIDESSYTADSHIAFLEFVLNVYDKSIQNVKFLVCDNENLNKSISRKLNIPMIGCASHRLNLAVKAALIDAQQEMDLVMKLMKKLSFLKQSAKLRKATNLRPVLRNETRWSSAYSMLQRYFDIQHFVDKTDPELLQLLSTPIQERKLTEEVLQDMKFFESISKKLQSVETTLADNRVLFDGLILKFQDKYPVITNYLATDASVINNQNFENAIANIINLESIDDENSEMVQFLKKVESNEETRSSEDFANQLLKQSQSRAYKYQCAKWIPCTSNRIERFFSEAIFFLGDYRSAILPKNLESQLFLHINKNFWLPVIVQKMMNSAE